MSKYTKQGQREQALKENATPAGREAMKAYFEKKRQTEATSLSGRDAMKAYFEKKRTTGGSETTIRQPQMQQTSQTPEQKIYHGEDAISQFYDNSPNGALYSQMFEYPEEVRNRMAQMQVQRLEQKMQKADLELKTVQARENVMATKAEELSVIAGNVENLRLQYEQTGDEVKRNAYLIAAQRYNEKAEEYNANLEKLQKDQKAYDNYNQAYANYERSRLTYEQRLADQKERDEAQREQLQKLAKEDPAAWLQATNPDGRQISRMLDQLERQRIQENERWAAMIEESGGMNWQTMTDEERKENEAKLAEHREIMDRITRQREAVEQLVRQRENEEGAEKAWNSSFGEFVDRIDNAVKAGVHAGFGGLNAVFDTAGNFVEYLVGDTLGAVARMTGNEALAGKAQRWMDASARYEGAEEWQAAADAYMQDALTGAGAVDGWIAQQAQSIGSMMVDMYTVGMGGVMSGGSSLAVLQKMPTREIMAIRASGSGMLDAAQKGYGQAEQIMVGVAGGVLEYLSEGMFGGNPIYDADAGWVTKAALKLFGNSKITKMLYSKGFDIFSEGIEEVFVELTQPVAEGILTGTDIDFASGEDLLSAFAGGIFLSLAGQGAQVMATEISGAGRAQRQAIKELGTAIQNEDAVQDLVLKGLAAQDGTRAYELAVQLQKKLDAGQTVSVKEIGSLLFAYQEAIEAGQLKEDTEVEPDKNAPQGALTDPEQGFYGIRIRKTEDGRNGYRLVHVLPDGEIRPLGQQGYDLIAAKLAAESQGLNIRHIGSEQALFEAAMAMNYEESSEAAAETVEPEYESETAAVAENTTDAELEELPWDGNGLSWAGNEATNENKEPAIEQPATGGIQWAGNEYEEGAANNGTEQQAKPESRRVGQNADQRRPAGRTNGRAGTGTQTGRAADVIRRSGEANRIRSYAASAKLERRSLKELGLPNGADGKILRVVPRGADPAVDRAIEIVENAGMRCVPISGSMFVNTPAGEQRMLGIYYKGTVYLQVDSVEATAEETAKHEVFHDRAAKDPKLVKRLIDYLYAHYTQDEFGARFNKYYEQYKGTYTYENEDQLRELIWKEFLADAYAEYSRYGDPELEGLSEVVQEEAWRKDGKSERFTVENGTTYSLGKLEQILLSREQIEKNIEIVASMEPVCQIDAEKLVPGEKSIKEIYREYFDDWGENIYSEILGDVAVKNSSIRSEIRHGSTPVKVASIEAIPSVIQQGKIVETIDKGEGVLRVVIAAPIKIGSTPYYMGVMLQRDSSNQRLYLHDVVVKKEASDPTEDHLSSTGSNAENENLFLSSILDRIFNVKKNEDGTFDGGYSAASEDKARQRAEREIARGIGEIMSMPRSAVQQLQKGLVREIMEEYQATGDLSTDKLQEIVATAFAQGLVVNNEYYETYKHVKDYLRTTPVTISEQDQADIADFTQFKKRAYGTLRIVKQGGTPVDVAYQEVQGMAPGLLKPEKTHPADQLMQLYEVSREIRRVETPLERAMGEESDQFYEWAEQKISNLVDRALTKYADSVSYKQQPENKPATRNYTSYEPDNYDFRAHERMYNYGQLDYYGMPEPGSGVVQEDYIQPEGDRLEWTGQMRAGNWVRNQERGKDEGRFDERTVESEDEEGQFVVDEFVPETVAEEALTEEERARRGTMREWIQYVLRDGVTPEEFSERMKNSSGGPLRGGAKTLVERMEETARQRRGDGVNLYRDPEMSDAEYEFLNAAWQNRQRAEQGGKSLTVDELIIPKNAFTSTPAMDRLGIKIDGSVTRYRETSMLIGYDKAAEQVQRNFNKRLKKLKATKQEMDLAKMIVAGSITPEMLNADQVNLNVVTELADYLWAIESFDADRVHQRRAEIDVNNMRIAKELLRDSDEYQPQLKGMLESFTKIVMNERTPERIMKQIFGQYQGNRLYETYFRPVWVNGAEMYRFENRMKKRVETFEDQTGTKRPLTELEREYVQRLMETEAVTERMKRLDPDSRERVDAAASNIRNGMAYLDAVREQNIGKNDENGGVVQAYVDYMRTVEVVKTMDQTILKNAVAEYRKIYNEMYAAINDFLVSHGYKPIGFIEGYAPHFQKAEVQNGLRTALKTLGVTNEKVDELPVEIAGRTADFRPNLKWNPHLKSRVGNKTDYDVQLGFERYLHYAAEIFYHTDDVMRIRQAVNYMRSQYSAAEVHAAIEDAQVDAFKDVKWKREFLIGKEVLKPQEEKTASEINQAYMAYVSGLFESAKPENLRKYSELVTWMDNYANIVAGKQSMADRGIEYGGGRNILNFGTKLMRAFASANVAGNLSSVLNQSAQLPLLRTELGKGYLLQAAKDLKNGTVEKESFADRSDFLTDKRGVDKLTVDNTEKIISKLFKPAEMADRIMSTLAVRGRYLKALDEGKTPEEALRIADDFGRRIMGSRMRGARPLGFESKTVVNQMLHVFQMEPVNTFDYMFLSDMPQAVKQVYKAKGKKAGNRYIAALATTYLISAFIMNFLWDELYGGSPAPYDIIGWLLNFVAGGWGVDDDEFLKIIVDNGSERLFGMRPFETRRPGDPTGLQWAGAMEDLSYNILGDVPYLRNVMGMAGLGDQSLPTVGINEMLEAAKHAGKTVVEQALYGKKETGLTWAGAIAEVAEDIGEIGVQIIPGGRQIKKTVQGIGSIVRGGKYAGYGENARLLYPVDRNAWNAVRATLFGPTALDETDEYYAGGKALTAGQTKIAKTLKKQGVDIEDTYLLYQVFSDINSEVGKEKITSTQARIKKRDAIAGMDLDDRQKLDVYLETMGGENEETRIKYMSLLTAGISWQQLTDLDNAYTALGEDADGDGEPDLDSVERGVAKRNAIAALDLSDYQKLEIFDRYHLDREAKNYETTRSELEAMLDAGLSWEEITEAHNTYARLNADEDMNATQKATAYAKWTDQQGWSDEQKAAVKNRYTFWQMIPAEASSYEKLTGAGLEPEAADYVVSVLADLEPEDGRETVNDVQKIEAIAGSELEQGDMNAAIRQMLSEKQAAIFDDLIANGLTAKQYAQYRRAVYGLESDKDANGNAISGSKKKKVLNAINALKITNRLKDALYLASGYGESTLDDAPWH